MKSKYLIVLFLLSFCIVYGVSLFVHTPGYMDAEYYYVGGTQLASGAGFQEPFLWNYIDSPAGLPHPSHTYWMPLASILAAVLPEVSGNIDFQLARVPFIILASLVSPLTAYLSFRLEPRMANAWMAGFLAMFPGFYLAYFGTTDTFALFMIFGTLFLIVSQRLFINKGSHRIWWVFAIGFIAGWMHLSRADGILWFVLSIGVILCSRLRNGRQFSSRSEDPEKSVFIIWDLFMGCIGYVLVMGLWYARNLMIYGSLMSPGSSYSLWMNSYNELFIYPATQLSMANWLQQGIPSIFSARWDALIANLNSFLGVQTSIFLAPFIMVGAWNFRRSPIVRIGLIGWGMIFFVMTFVFPFAGSRGGFFHSGAALQPLFWALAPFGLATVVQWFGRIRKWTKTLQATKVFRMSLIVLSGFLSLTLTYQRIIGPDIGSPIWEESITYYQQIGNVLDKMSIAQDQIIMVNNPPGFFCATNRVSIVVPDGDLNVSLRAARQYKAAYLLLEANHPVGLNPLYDRPQSNQLLEYVSSVNQAYLFRIKP